MQQRWMIVGVLCLWIGMCCAQTIDIKSDPDYRRELKRLKKEKWQTKQSVSLEEQLAQYYTMLLAEDDKHAPLYVVGKAKATGGSYQSALRVATMNARRDLAANISTQVEAIVEATVSNNATDLVAYSQQLVAERLVEATAVLTLYRTNGQNNTEVCTYILYPWSRVAETVNEAITHSK